MEGAVNTLANAITTGITSAVTAVGNVLTAIFTESGAWASVLPAIGLAVGFFVISIGIGIVKSLVKGY